MTRIVSAVAGGLLGLLTGCNSYERCDVPRSAPIELAIPPSDLLDLDTNPPSTAYFEERLNSYLQQQGITDASERARLINDSGISYGQSVNDGDVDFQFSVGHVDEFGLSDLMDDDEEEVIDTEPRRSLDAYGARGAKFYPLNNIPFTKVTLNDVQTLANQYEGLSTIPMDPIKTTEHNEISLREYNALFKRALSSSANDADRLALTDARSYGHPLMYALPGAVFGVVTHSSDDQVSYYALRIDGVSKGGGFLHLGLRRLE